MDINKCFDFLSTQVPSHCSHISDAMAKLSKELEYTKALLSRKLIDAQNQDDYKTAREIIDVQEQLSKWMQEIDTILQHTGFYKDSTDSSENDFIEEIADELIETMDYDVEKEDNSEREITDYSQFSVDDSVPFDIEDTSVTFKRPAGFSIGEKRYYATTWQDVIIKISGLLYAQNPDVINELINKSQSKGQRGAFSYEKTRLRRPKIIPGTDLWIETNRNAVDIRKTIIKLLQLYNIPTYTVKLYFRRDYSNLHE